MRIAVSILHTLVHQKIREELQLSYAPDASMNDDAANTASMSVSTNDPNRATQEMLNQSEFLQQNTLRQDAIDGRAAFFLTQHYMGQETSGAQVGELARYELIGGGWKNAFEFMNGIRSVKAAEVQDVANRYMKNVRFAVVGNTAGIERAVFVTAAP